MHVLKKVLRNQLLIFLLNSVMIEISFAAVVLSVYDGGVPDVSPKNSGLVEVIRVFEE